ncbi:hypothetical protein EJB05_08164 [Eragrostis curvula]|uniref:Major facilitator superfamily (MFS) profile domain-containing protein n=1 Tax=Eragrostis curvula TaxID=38414 RepID=A0A5J9WKT1_9POAL|nr:hypothetical protein EJB05_08164 [Eragrostis curvula]
MTPRLRNNDAVLVAAVASIGNMLQGWDNASIASSMFYIREEFHLQSMPVIQGFVMAIGLIGAMIITTFSGFLADKLGRRKMLIASAMSYFVGSILTLLTWSTSMLLFTRLMSGFGIGLAMTIAPLYISEIAPTEKRGLLNTFPQLSGSGGMFLSYCVGFCVSLIPNNKWRLMFAFQAIPSFLCFVLTVFYLPESPKWLIRQGRAVEAKKVMERLQTTEDVKGQVALLIEGTGGGQTASMEEYFIGPNDEVLDSKLIPNEDMIKLYNLDQEEPCCVAYPIKDQSTHEDYIGLSKSHGRLPLDPIVDLIATVNERFLEESNILNEREEDDEWDEENPNESEEHLIEHKEDDNKDSLYSPLISRSRDTGKEDLTPSLRSGIIRKGSGLEIGGGWQLAWRLPAGDLSNGQEHGGIQRMYIHQEFSQSSHDLPLDVPLSGKFIQAAALVNKSVLTKDHIESNNIDLANLHQSNEDGFEGTTWASLLTPAVKRALVVAIGIQMLQQFAGINGVLYYTPEILEQGGAGVLLSTIGLTATSASILISALTTLVMLPFIGISMWLMDRKGRRWLLLVTIPILLVSLIVLVVVNIVTLSTELHATLSTISVGIYLCVFVMGFGPIPNILCAEIFPTSARAMCSTIYGLTFWICDIIVTYSLPMLLRSIGLAGVFGTYATICLFALVFVYCKVPETKGMPVEVIVEFFSVGRSVSHFLKKKEDKSCQKDT